MSRRLAGLLAVLFLLGAAFMLFAPFSSSDVDCGSIADQKHSLDTLVADESTSEELSACDDATDTRRTVLIVLIAAAIVIPAGILFVVGASAKPDANT